MLLGTLILLIYICITTECPTKEIPSKTDRNDNNSLELGIGIGMPVLITLVLAIVIGIIFYKRWFYS